MGLPIPMAFPSYGRCMIDGHLRHMGHRISRVRLQQSYAHVHGPPVSAFGPRRIHRRVYYVPGPNSLWHHDGQHGIFSYVGLVAKMLSTFFIGLIRWGIVFHAFIDGKSRCVTGIRAHNN